MSPKNASPAEPGSTDELTPEWKEILYAPERVERWIRGEITLQQLSTVSGDELLEMAATGFALFVDGRHREARAIFQGLASLDPNEPYYPMALGAIALAEDELETAQRLLDEAIRLDDREIAAYVNRGEVHLRQGRWEEAAADFARAIALDPEGRDPLSRRARSLADAAAESLG